MRIVTWNCRIGGFRRKSERVAPFGPDILAVQEVEPLDKVLIFGGDKQPTFRDRMSDPTYPKRSIGVFSYTGLEMQTVDAGDPMYGFRRYTARYEGTTFHVAAVWTSATKSAATSYRQAHAGLVRHADWIQKHPTVILGDFNGNASFRGNNWKQLLELMAPLGLVSAYHEFFGEMMGAESRPTHFHHGKQERPFHLDYCFLPRSWASLITNVSVGEHSNWCTVSDHVPLIVDIDLPIASTDRTSLEISAPTV